MGLGLLLGGFERVWRMIEKCFIGSEYRGFTAWIGPFTVVCLSSANLLDKTALTTKHAYV